MDTVVALLQRLIQIPSVNPDADPSVSPVGEKEVALFVSDFLAPLGFDCTLEEIQPGRPNLIARCPGPPDRPRILLGPHLDTVKVTGMTIDPFAADLRDHKVWGRGASDTKGPMAAMLWGLRENADLLPSLPVAVDFIGFMGEEVSQPGSRHFAQQHASQYQFAIAGEPTSLQAVHCTKGCLWAEIEATGLATHASQPHLGENAILKLLAEIHSLTSTLPATLTSVSHPILGTSTLNIGLINGGASPNIVPERATATLDIRTVPALVADHPMQTLLASHLTHTTIRSAQEFPPMDLPADHPWLQRLQQIHPGLILAGAPWFSDAAHLAKAGLPSICLGPGSIDQAHTADEFITIDNLEAGARWFTKLIQGLSA